ncbi:MAG: family 10 glycosylhydrolase [Muribaculum sp.]|nr:family 10 glycosylhydrolase [Muribaculaceae bacterium]MCM1081201.1 family 10 glycosylhydrolase [Muribaculum sp.]
MRIKITLSTLILFLSFLFAAAEKHDKPEVRAVWLTTNMGLDWPGSNFNPAEQRQQMINILDKLHKANFNLVFFQVQANGDVLWNSKFEPAMADVTGNGSKPLSYDVCNFVISECHKRSMECHAWIVPFRLGTAKNAARYSDSPVKHPYYTKNGRTVDHQGTRYLDPSDPKARKFLIELYRELVENYPFDGIHLDYTRYPGNDFNDKAAYESRTDKSLSHHDWRRNNLNTFVSELYTMVADSRPGMIVGSAPIGSYRRLSPWKNATAYESFQQDPGQWIASGSHDMIVPQMYWGERNGFSAHMKAWADIAADSCTLVIGLAPYKMVTEKKWTVDSVTSQIKKARQHPTVEGVCFFRAEHVVGNSKSSQKLYRQLCNSLFRRPAPLPWDVFD